MFSRIHKWYVRRRLIRKIARLHGITKAEVAEQVDSMIEKAKAKKRLKKMGMIE